MPRLTECGRGIFLSPNALLGALLTLTALVYVPGLSGPFLFDDPPNIILPITAWLSGQTGWQEVVFGNGSGVLHRPLANLSFAMNAAISGLDPLPFKITNLALHMLCGVLIYSLLRHLLRRDQQLSTHASFVACVVAALWLLHPIQVSTVLYIVQRMAQLSALFMLVAMLAFVHGRVALEAGRLRPGWIWLFIGVPTATVAAMLGKENGALVPLLCAAIELGYFRCKAQVLRPKAVKLFFALFLVLPAAAVIIWYSLHPGSLLNGYEGRLFTFGERLLSQPRALMDYMGALLLPQGPSLGIYTDDFVVSRGLLEPPSTLLAITGLTALVFAALWARTRAPTFFTGIGIYLTGHAMESTVFPLEMYFEHRNYLPSFGFFLALAGLGGWLLPHLLSRSDNPHRLRNLLTVSTAAMLVLLAFATYARADIWSSWQRLAAQGVREHPQSMRAHLDQASLLQLQGRHADAQQVFDYMTTMESAQARHAGIIDSVTLQCMTKGATTHAAVARIATINGSKLQLGEMLALENLGNHLSEHNCENLKEVQLADLIVVMVNAAPQPPHLVQLWRSRFNASRLYAASGLLGKAKTQAALAWMSGAADPSVGLFLAKLYQVTGDVHSARLILADARKRVSWWDQRNLDSIEELEQTLDGKN